jgi:ABC-type glycerol-3-phosphate transport system substrate-binding protein
MRMMKLFGITLPLLTAALIGCSSDDDSSGSNKPATGGAMNAGGAAGTGASPASGGAMASGGGMATGGTMNGTGGAAPSGAVEFLTAWQDNDLKAVQAVEAGFEAAHPTVTVTVDRQDDVVKNMENRFTKGLGVPDVIHRPNDENMLKWMATDSIMDLGALYESEAWNDHMPAPLVQKQTLNGKTVAVPVNIQRLNSVFYNKKLFAANGLVPPTTIPEFKALVAKLKDDVGVTPMVIGNQWDWTFWMFVFTCLAPNVMGPDHYAKYFSGEAASPDDAKLTQMLETALYFRCGPTPEKGCDGFFNADIDTMDHYPSVESFIGGFQADQPQVAMLPAGDWVKSWIKDAGLKPGEDFDAFECPVMNAADERLFIASFDSIAAMKNAPNPQAADLFLRYFGSVEGQVAFNAKKGSIPARTDVDLAQYPDAFDSLQLKTHKDFQTHRYFDPGYKAGALPNMMAELKQSMQDGSIEIVHNYIKNNYDTLK